MKTTYSKSAIKTLRRIQPKKAKAIRDAVEEIAADPFAPHANVTAMQGEQDAFRLRAGDWRVVYRVDREVEILNVVRVAPRGKVYK